ncbi:hypothetical protein KEM54_006266 [Ascosphaera aggregata]|nr:hypothetical protein KEM54_006266 [Ascosphaera aggregata]
MGIVSSRPDDPDAALYLKDPTKSDDALIEFVQDPESASVPPRFLLKLNTCQELYFNFTFTIRQTDSRSSLATVNGVTGSLSQTNDTSLTGLTFAHATNLRELDNLITREFHANPNLQNNSNVQFIGDFATAGWPSYTFNWTWKWTPPRVAEDRARGWRNSCSFLEYDQRTNRLNTLATFSFWVYDSSDSPPLRIIPPLPHHPSSSRSDQLQSRESVVSALPATSAQSEALDNASTFNPSAHPSHSVKVDLHCQRPGEDMSVVEDGPLFRATMKALEQKTGAMRAKIKKVLKKAEVAYQAQVTCNEAANSFIGALAEASSDGIQPAVEHYFDRIARQLLIYEEQNSLHLQKLVIEPLSKLYNHDIKLAEAKRKDFEEESKDYYAYVGRYLGQRQDSLKHKKRAESDSKYQSKRRNFELKRFDYSSFMQDLHGGRKEQEMLSHLTRYANFQARSYLSTAKNIEAMMPQLEALVEEVTKADKEYEFQRTEREEKRRTLEKSAKAYVEPEMLAPPSTSTPGLAMSPEFDLSRAESNASHMKGLANTNSSHHSADSKSRVIREYEIPVQTEGEQRKEGLVWALSRPGSHIDPKGINKQAWHKFWIVLDQGKLSEYSNWKQKLDLHIGPIDLRMASVREARSTERRFCFEVITPAFKRTYQATSEDDMHSWILAISNALQSAVEGRAASSPPLVSEGPSYRDIGNVLTGKSTTQSASSNHAGGTTLGIGRRTTVGGRPNYVREVSGGAYDENPSKLLQMIRDADPSNKCCADCGSSSKVEWVSINLGMVYCIECSGIHRSLGTHISKIRSLTLDVHSFTIDLVEMIIQIGNRVGNSVWEGHCDPSLKPLPTSSREERLKFITAKYAQRAYVQQLSPTLSRFSTANETLIAAVKKNDIENVLYGIALGADLNATDRSRGTRAFFLALAAADPAAPSPSMRQSSSKASLSVGFQATEQRSISFPVAELLVQNGADIPSETPSIPLSFAAQIYYTQRSSKGARNPVPFDSHLSSAGASNSPKIHPSLSTAARVENMSGGQQSAYSTEGRDRDKSNKRGSAGARFAGKVASLGLDR